MVSIQTNHRKETTMQRAFALLLAALLLTACRPVTVPQLPAATPTPDPEAAFRDAYNAATFAYNAIRVEVNRDDLNDALNDPAFRERVQEMARDWRTKSNDLRYMEQPPGEKWERAWPRIMDAMEEYAYVASVLEVAMRENTPLLMAQTTGRADMANALLNEAMEILRE